MDFPHISDTQFPNLDNVNVYKYQNVFDYARWNGKVTFKLINVLWNSNYTDVPYFETVKERDNWFNEQDGYVGTLETLFNNTPQNAVKVPIPYNDAYKYNYLVVDMPEQTSVDNPINYEDSNIRIKRWFYFIEDMQQFAPSTTELIITLDFWTTFIHSVEIPYLMLERGHAPMMQTTVEEFLANPITNNEYLLADDFNYSNETIIQTSNYYPIGNGKKYVLFCAPYSREAFDRFDGVKYSGNATPPTYSNIDNRWGYQLQVNDYQWKYGNVDYSNSQLPIYNMVQTGLLNGCECFAIEGSVARDFFNDCAQNCVQFIHGIQAMFILDESLFIRSLPFEFRGYTLYIADRKINNIDIQLHKEHFGFDSKYADITKLYTFPYSSLEVTDDVGNSFIARVENCGDLKIHEEVSLVYPFLNYNVFLSGINGNGEMQYIWKNIQDTDANQTIWADDFSKYMMNWDVPVYSIYVSSEYEYAVNNFFNNKAKRAGAIKDYENAVRYANTTKENTNDSYITNTDNVAATGATDTSNMQRTTTKNVNNTNRTQQGLIDNSQDLMDFRDDKFDLEYSGTPISGGGIVNNKYWHDITKMNNDANTDCDFIDISLAYTQDYIAATSVINGVGSMVTGGLSKGVEGLATGAIDAVGTGFSAMAIVTKDVGMANANKGNIRAKRDNAVTYIDGYAADQKDYARSMKNNENDYTVKTVNRFSLVNPSMGVSEGINCTNAKDDKNANDANALAIQNTNNANAVRTQNTEIANATYSRNANIAAEKANLVQKQLEAEYQYRNARLHAPVTYSKYSGNMFQDVYKRRGVRFNVRTQSKSAIAQTGDAFLRFGYALHRVWDMSQGFHYGKHFTFWKAEDIWINDGTGVANIATNTISNILMKGVTVWRKPEEIGTVGIYDNI